MHSFFCAFEASYNRFHFQRLEALSKLSVWDEEDEQAVIESQNFINQWKVVEF